MTHDDRCHSANRFGDGFEAPPGLPIGTSSPRADGNPPPEEVVAFGAAYRCEASRGFERHNAGQCGKAAGHEVSGVGLCAYHNALRGYVPVLYLADGRGMNHAGVVGAPPERPADAAEGVVDALVALAERMVPDDATPEYEAVTSGDPADMLAAVNALMPPSTVPPPAIPSRDARPCMPPTAIPVPPFMSTDSAVRKSMPVASGFLAYFADAVMLASMVSVNGANKHCNGVLGWDKSKSADEPDAEVRHMLDVLRGLPPDPGLETLGHLGHYASKLWRAAADCQRACDEVRAAYARGEDWRK